PLVITEDYNFSLSKFSAQERGELDSFVKELIRENILVRDQKNGKEIWILFKNDRIKEWFEKTGNVFEMFTYSAVCSILSKDTAGLKNMVLSDAKIYWPEVENLFNEIDVVFMHGYIPVFVSCKNGKIGDSELYKFKIVAERFGGPYAKKILIAAESLEDLMGEGTGIKFRSESFGINVIDGVEKMKTPVELGAKILKILNGK
ncbi:MAG: DUF1887 family CARF protein, partial [Bacillota bacterium]|nr:DUF1887 family CARF protein [Bacillota bacterium]